MRTALMTGDDDDDDDEEGGFGLDPRWHARRGDPDTSHAAASELSDKTTMMRRLLAVHVGPGLTSEEASWVCGYTAEDGAWKRVSDLAVLGLITDTGVRRFGSSGRRQMVRRVTEEGGEVLDGTRAMPAVVNPKHLDTRKIDTLRRLAIRAEEKGWDALPLSVVWKILNATK